MTINEKIFSTMEKKNLRQIDLAKKLNVSKAIVNAWKTRRTDPPAKYLIGICEFLKITIYELLGEKDKYSKEEELIIQAYSNASEGIQNSVKKLLDVPEEKQQSYNTKIG